MTDVPTYSGLAGTEVDVIYGLMSKHADSSLAWTTLDFAWQRDRALLEAIDGALSDAASEMPGVKARKPRWLDGLVQRELRSGSQARWWREQSVRIRKMERFGRIRLMERLGLISLVPDDTYVLAMISALGPNKSDTLRADPELVERGLWRVFEVEGGGEVSLTNVDRLYGGQWRNAFLELTADGTIDRTRVLAECLEALGRDFAAYPAAWFSATFLALEPSAEEMSVLQAALRRLLAAPGAATVAFTLKQLTVVQKAGLLEIEETLQALAPATLVKAKGRALDALRLAKALAGGREAAASTVATTALGHPHADVQRTAADMLRKFGDFEAVAMVTDDLSPSVQRDLGLAVTVVPEEPASTIQPRSPIPSAATAADLAERTAALLEDASDVGELEAVLAALVSPGSEGVLGPLRKRAKSVVARGRYTDVGDSWLPGQVARLVLGMLGEPVPPAEPNVPALRFITRRVAELRRSEAPLLATPDMPGGWVSPSALVDRLAANPEPRHHDLIAALLRLHPDGRAELAAPTLPAAVTFALDGIEPARRLLGSGREGPAAWWTAAERSRGPYGEREVPTLDGDIQTHTWQEVFRGYLDARYAVTTSSTRKPVDDQPTTLLAQTIGQLGGGGYGSSFLGDWIPNLAALWPHDAEHFLAHTCMTVLESPGWTDAAHDVARVLDALARHPGRMGVLATHTLAAGLSATQRHHRLHAVDAFVDLVPSGRIAAGDIASAMAWQATAWPATRWAESLASISQTPGAAASVIDILTALLPQLPTDHRSLNKLLDLLRDETIRQGISISEPTLTGWLGQLGGSSAAAKTARQLLG